MSRLDTFGGVVFLFIWSIGYGQTITFNPTTHDQSISFSRIHYNDRGDFFVTDSYDNAHNTRLFVAFNRNLDTLWTKHAPLEYPYYINDYIIEDSIPRYACGTADSGIFLCEFDSNFDTIWTKVYHDTMVFKFAPLKLMRFGDSLVIGGSYYKGMFDCGYFAMFDTLGDMKWHEFIETGIDNSVQSIMEYDGFIHFSGIHAINSYKLWTGKINSQGLLVWQDTIDHNEYLLNTRLWVSLGDEVVIASEGYYGNVYFDKWASGNYSGVEMVQPSGMNTSIRLVGHYTYDAVDYVFVYDSGHKVYRMDSAFHVEQEHNLSPNNNVDLRDLYRLNDTLFMVGYNGPNMLYPDGSAIMARCIVPWSPSTLSFELEEPEQVGLVVYPNPTSEGINIVSNDKVTEVSIFDFLGRQVVYRQNPPTHIDLDLSPGVYVARILAGGRYVLRELVIQ